MIIAFRKQRDGNPGGVSKLMHFVVVGWRDIDKDRQNSAGKTPDA